MPNGGIRRRILANGNCLAVRCLALLFGFLFCSSRVRNSVWQGNGDEIDIDAVGACWHGTPPRQENIR